MVGRERRYNRLGQRYSKTLLTWVIFIFLSIVAVIFISGLLSVKTDDFGVMEIGDPIQVYWWNNESGQFSQIILPANVYTDVIGEYSQYTLSAIWKLGLLDTKSQLLLNKTVSLVLNLPVKWYVSGSQISPEFKPGNNSYSYLFQSVFTNLPFPLYVFYARNKLFTDKSDMQVYDFTGPEYLNRHTLADGQEADFLNLEKIDAALSHDFESESIRKENLKIAVLNATDIPGLGDRMSKILSRLGIYVGTVSNITTPVVSCRIIGKTEALKTMTSRLIESVFGCVKETRTDDKPYDMEVLMGSGIFPF